MKVLRGEKSNFPKGPVRGRDSISHASECWFLLSWCLDYKKFASLRKVISSNRVVFIYLFLFLYTASLLHTDFDLSYTTFFSRHTIVPSLPPPEHIYILHTQIGNRIQKRHIRSSKLRITYPRKKRHLGHKHRIAHC